MTDYRDDMSKPRKAEPRQKPRTEAPTVHDETQDILRWDNPIFPTPTTDTGGSEMDPVPAERYGPALPTLEERLLAAEDNGGIAPPDPRYG